MANDVSTQTASLATIPTTTKIATVLLGTSSGHVQLISLGGQVTAACPASGSVTVVKAVAALLARVLVTTAGTAAMTIYDHASAASGTVVGVIPANAPAGSIYEFHMPCALGIVLSASASNPAVTVAYA